MEYEMEVSSLVVAIFAALISIGSAFAAWRAVRPRPKLKGSVTFAWSNGFSSIIPDLPSGRIVGLHILLTNSSVHPVHPLRFELEAKRAEQWIPGTRIQNWQSSPVEIRIGNNDISLDQQHLVDWPPRPIHHGAPMMGFIVHLVPGITSEEEIDAYRVTVTDVFGGQITFDKDAAPAHTYSASRTSGFTAVEAFRHAGASVTVIP
ncbi:hypothetical protein ACIQNG_34080 [Streptomyces sp. NPDC091377]|uniref:hypothetical protein n=1 Tax=Streptomyces sp. NPDC091377 TaxID=3365995 RepID=UPI0038014E0B